MKKDLLLEYAGYLTVRGLGAAVILLSPRANYALAKAIGILGYYLLNKKRNLVIKNLKIAFNHKYTSPELRRIARESFVSFALSIIETLYIPKIDKRYINKHIRVENLGYLDSALEKAKGVIFLAYHIGNWELANITCAMQGYDYKVIVNEQRYPLLNNLLKNYRESKGCKTILRGIAIREILKALKNNQVVAMVGDQGGRRGELIDLLGMPVSTPVGFARFALNTGAVVIPAIIIRERGFFHRIILEEPLGLEQGRSDEGNIRECLIRSNRILGKYITKYPQEYFWFYKIWKYSPLKNIVVLSDGKAGHLRQSLAAADLAAKSDKKKSVQINVVEIKFKSKLRKALADVSMFLRINILKHCLEEKCLNSLEDSCADLVVSCAGSLAGVNLLLAEKNLAKSACIMKPRWVNPQRFDLLILPKHDQYRRSGNGVETLGALNPIDEGYLRENAAKLNSRIKPSISRPALGLFLGGDNKSYALSARIAREVINAVKAACAALTLDILVSTSRRTSAEIEDLVKKELSGFSPCKLLIIANEENIPEAVGGILGLSDLVVVSAESVSMVSEAASSGKTVLAFSLSPKRADINKKHQVFLDFLEKEGYIFLSEAAGLEKMIEEIFADNRKTKRLQDRLKVEEAIRRLI